MTTPDDLPDLWAAFLAWRDDYSRHSDPTAWPAWQACAEWQDRAAPAVPAHPDAHELWAAAQLVPGEGIEDGVARIEGLLGAEPARALNPDLGDRFMANLRAIHGEVPDSFADSARLAFVHTLKEAMEPNHWHMSLAAPAQPQPLTDERILALATAKFPRWREDIQERFVLELARAVLVAAPAMSLRDDFS